MYKGTITGCYDPKQFWIVTYSDGDVEDWGVGDMKRRVPSFVCGPVIDGVTEHTATAVHDFNLCLVTDQCAAFLGAPTTALPLPFLGSCPSASQHAEVHQTDALFRPPS